MPAPHDAAVRRFTAVWGVSLLVKLAALVVFLVIVWKLAGGF